MSIKAETAFRIIVLIPVLGILILIAFIAWRSTDYETITVTSKEALDDGMECFGSQYHKTCHSYFIYYVNGQRVTGALFSSVEEGKIYSCWRTIFGGWNKCEKVEDE